MGRGVATEPIHGPSVREAPRRRSRPSARADAEPLHLRVIAAGLEPVPLEEAAPFRLRRDPLALRRAAMPATNVASAWGNEAAIAVSDDRSAARRRLMAAGSVLLLHALFLLAALALRNAALEETPPMAVEVLWVEPAASSPPIETAAVETPTTAEPPPAPIVPPAPAAEPPPVEPPVAAIEPPMPVPDPEPVAAAPEPAEVPALPQAAPAEPVLLPKPKPVPPPAAARREASAAPARPANAAAPIQEARLEPPTTTPAPAPATVLPPSPIAGSMAKPAYPAEAMRRRLQGTVLLHIDVAASGVPTAAAVVRSSGHRLLDDAAVAGVLRWRFTPASRGGEAVASAIDHAVEFRLVD